MRSIIIAFTVLAAATLSGCSDADLAANMQKAKDVAAAINRGALVTASAVRQGIDAACSNQPAVGVAYQTARAILMQQTGPNSTRNIDNLDKAVASYTTVCAAAANPNATDLASLLSRAIAAYAAFEAAKAKAGV